MGVGGAALLSRGLTRVCVRQGAVLDGGLAGGICPPTRLGPSVDSLAG